MIAQTPLFDIAAPTSPPAPGFSGRDLLRLVFKHKAVVLTCAVVVSTLTVLGALQLPQTYTATAQVWVKTDQQGAPSFLSGVTSYRESTAQDPPSRTLETEMSLLVNRSSLDAVIMKLHLQPDQLLLPPLVVMLKPLKARIADARKALGMKPKAVRPPEFVDPAEGDPLAETVLALTHSITMEPVRSKGAETTSNVIEITLGGTDRRMTQLALSALLDEYERRSTTQDRELGHQAFVALRGQTAQALSDLTQAEDTLVNYAVNEGANGIAPEQLRALATAPQNGMRAGAVLSGSGVDASQLTATAKLRADLQDAQARLDGLRQTYTDDFDGVRSTQRQVEQLRARLVAETRQQARTNATVGQLERKRAMAQERYVELQRKLDQIALYLKLAPTEINSRLLLEPPRAAEKASAAGRLAALVMGPVAGLLLGLLLAVLLEFADRRLQTRDAVQRHLGLDVLMSVPNRKVFGRRRRRRRLPPVRSPLDSVNTTVI